MRTQINRPAADNKQVNNLTLTGMQTLPAPAAVIDEFHEADVLWPDDHHHHYHHHDDRCCHGHHQKQLKGRRPRNHAAACGCDVRHRRPASSAPVAIPRSSTEPATTWAPCYCYEDDDGGDEASFVPPHMLVARRKCSEERAACPMCVGRGRTLKGRDLRCVRTAVLRMTGFLEA